MYFGSIWIGHFLRNIARIQLKMTWALKPSELDTGSTRMFVYHKSDVGESAWLQQAESFWLCRSQYSCSADVMIIFYSFSTSGVRWKYNDEMHTDHRRNLAWSDHWKALTAFKATWATLERCGSAALILTWTTLHTWHTKDAQKYYQSNFDLLRVKPDSCEILAGTSTRPFWRIYVECLNFLMHRR